MLASSCSNDNFFNIFFITHNLLLLKQKIVTRTVCLFINTLIHLYKKYKNILISRMAAFFKMMDSLDTVLFLAIYCFQFTKLQCREIALFWNELCYLKQKMANKNENCNILAVFSKSEKFMKTLKGFCKMHLKYFIFIKNRSR